MRQALVVTVLTAALAGSTALVTGQTPPAAGTSLGTVTLGTRVLADGKTLPAGTYQVRLTGEEAKPALGTIPERYVEFVRSGAVVGRELAILIPASEIDQVAQGPRPATGGSRVEMLKGNDYVRIWINRDGINYLIHMPPATS